MMSTIEVLSRSRDGQFEVDELLLSRKASRKLLDEMEIMNTEMRQRLHRRSKSKSRVLKKQQKLMIMQVKKISGPLGQEMPKISV